MRLPLGIEASPPRPRRVLGELRDAGPFGREYECPRCARRWVLPDRVGRLRIRSCCPTCNTDETLKFWGAFDELAEVWALDAQEMVPLQYGEHALPGDR